MKPKAQTLIQKMGFADDDLKNSRHDEIMIWTVENLETIVKPILIGRKYEWWNTDSHQQVDQVATAVNSISKTIWEKPIEKGDRGFIVGFVDLYVEVEVILCNEKTEEKTKTTEYFIFEIKTKIDSVGEVIRQINTYRGERGAVYGSQVFWFIVSPDDRYISILKSQGIGFVKYPQSSGQRTLFD